METHKLICAKRDKALKAKEIRNKGFVPAVVYGHHLDPINIQIDHVEASKFLKNNTIGSKVLLMIGKEEHLAIFKDSQKDLLNNRMMHMDFQALTTGEKIKVTVPIRFKNKDLLGSDKVFQEKLSEIEISTLPKFLVDHVEVDVSKYDLGDTFLVGDLDISSNENIDVLSPKESQVFIISHAAKFKEETLEDQEPEVIAEEREEQE